MQKPRGLRNAATTKLPFNADPQALATAVDSRWLKG